MVLLKLEFREILPDAALTTSKKQMNSNETVTHLCKRSLKGLKVNSFSIFACRHCQYLRFILEIRLENVSSVDIQQVWIFFQTSHTAA